jgi:hypothetical protein
MDNSGTTPARGFSADPSDAQPSGTAPEAASTDASRRADETTPERRSLRPPFFSPAATAAASGSNGNSPNTGMPVNSSISALE